jgi:hypothetical protein
MLKLVQQRARMGRLGLILKQLLKVCPMKLSSFIKAYGDPLQNYHLEMTHSRPKSCATYWHTIYINHNSRLYYIAATAITTFVAVTITYIATVCHRCHRHSCHCCSCRDTVTSSLSSSFSPPLLNLPFPSIVFCFYEDSRLLGFLTQFFIDLQVSWGASLPQ